MVTIEISGDTANEVVAVLVGLAEHKQKARHIAEEAKRQAYAGLRGPGLTKKPTRGTSEA